MTRKEAYEIIEEVRNKICSHKYATEQSEAFDMVLELLKQGSCDDAIRTLAQKHYEEWHDVPTDEMNLEQARQAVRDLRKFIVDNHISPKLQVEPLTDTEQRIFLAAMSKEEKVCKEVDGKYPVKEPYEDSLVSVCHSIEKKVKKALWG